MGQDILAGHTYDESEAGAEVNFTNLNEHVNGATLKETVISARTAKSPAALTDLLLISDGALKKATIQEIVTLTSKNPGVEIITDRTAESAIAGGDTFLVYDTSATALRKCTRNELLPAGSVVQVQQHARADIVTGTSNIPSDDTVPEIGEGVEVLTKAITPQSATNKILVSASVHVSTNGSVNMAIAVFRGTVCIAADASACANQVGLFVEFLDEPDTTDATTYSVRVGGEGSSNFGVNSRPSAHSSRIFGGVCQSTLTLKEIKA